MACHDGMAYSHRVRDLGGERGASITIRTFFSFMAFEVSTFIDAAAV